jgi:hypothetical protein
MHALLSLAISLSAGLAQLPATVSVEQTAPLSAALNSTQTLKFERDSLEQALLALAKQVQRTQP